MDRKILTIAIILILLGILGAFFYLNNFQRKEILIDNSFQPSEFITQEQFSIASGVVPHHLLAEEILSLIHI